MSDVLWAQSHESRSRIQRLEAFIARQFPGWDAPPDNPNPPVDAPLDTPAEAVEKDRLAADDEVHTDIPEIDGTIKPGDIGDEPLPEVIDGDTLHN